MSNRYSVEDEELIWEPSEEEPGQPNPYQGDDVVQEDYDG